ncbi:MAG: hypothetical protein AAF726_08785 [Planctomycetota bacterium]
MNAPKEVPDWRRGALVAVLATLVVRIAVGLALDLPAPMKPGAEAWDWAYEQGAVSAAVLRGDGFADPFAKGTGATAWCGCVFPSLLAAVTWATDGPSDATVRWLAYAHVALGAVIAWQLAALGAALGRARLGAVAAWLWALHPLASYYAWTVVWDSHLVAATMLGALVSFARAGAQATQRELVRPGLWFGLAALVNAAALALTPAIVAFFVRGRRPVDAVRSALTVVGATALVALPWSLRNLAVLGTPNLKANLGVELLVGNNDDADGGFHAWIHPAYNESELARYVELGERDYGADCRDRALEWIESNPGRFAELTLVRARNVWIGLDPTEPVPLRSGRSQKRDAQGWVKWAAHFLVGLLGLIGLATYRDARGGWWLVGGTAVLYPLVYYVTHVLERYRLPMEPIVTYLAASALLSIVGLIRQRD